MPTDWIRAAALSDLAADRPTALGAGGLDLVAVPTASGPKVYEGRCPHQGALLGEGELDGATLVCRNHRWRFDTTTGQRDGGPQCLRACPTEVRDGALFVDVTSLRADAMTKGTRTLADLPGPKARPIVGNALQLDVTRLHQCLEDWARAYGPMFHFRVVGKHYVGVSDPELVEAVLRARPETYRRDERVEPVFRELGVAGVFSAEGAAWRSQRKLAMEALSQRNLRGFYPTLAKVAERLRARWAKAAAAGAVSDLIDDLTRFTVDVTTTLTFGKDLDTLSDGDDVIQKDLALIFPAFARRLNAIVPYWRVLRLPKDRRVDRAIAKLRAWLHELITETRANLAPGRPPANFLEAMLSARDDDGQPFSEEIVFGNCMTMLLAGEDTTAQSLAWAVHLLCEHPAEITALRAHTRGVIGDAPFPADLERANKLERATAITHEAMRLQPVAPLNFFMALHDTVLGDVAIPKGTGVVAIQRPAVLDDKHFEAAAEFRPGRWIGEPTGAHDASTLMPFGSGPRICPGRTLALVEMRVVLATLYQSFDVTRVGAAADVKEKYAFTVMPSQLQVRLRARGSDPRP